MKGEVRNRSMRGGFRRLHYLRKDFGWGLMAAIALSVIATVPTIMVWHDRGSAYNGFYALQQFDEEAYAGYINSLISGGSRLSDPAQCGTNSQFESLFSIQFFPSQLISVPARIVGISTSTVFLILQPVMAFLSTFVIYLVLRAFTNNSLLSATGALCVLCFGTMISGEGIAGDLLGAASDFHGFLFLRRYLPAIPFPLFFLFCLFTWKAFEKDSISHSIGASAILFVLVFSYFYLWTVAIAWLLCASLLVGFFQPFRRSVLVKMLIPLLLSFGSAAFIYVRLLGLRSRYVDQVVAIEHTRMPDLFRICELACLVMLLILIVALRRKVVKVNDPKVLFLISLLLISFLVFNQQVLTGRSVQPFHYELFIINYVTGFAAVLLTWLLVCHRLTRVTLLLLAVMALTWGLVEILVCERLNHYENVRRDELVSVAQKISGDGFVYSEDIYVVANHISTISTSAVLWALHTKVCSGINTTESKERFYKYLYYAGYTPDDLQKSLMSGAYLPTVAIFGYERATTKLTQQRKPLSKADVTQEVQLYAEYISHYDKSQATDPKIGYVITSPDFPNYPVNLDLWYDRDEGEQIGGFKLYHLYPKK